VLITLIAGICNAIPTVLNGAIGANLHVPFPIASRASFGYGFSYFAVMSRAILAMFWFGVHTGYGGTCVSAVRRLVIAGLTLLILPQDADRHLAQFCNASQPSPSICWSDDP
jgi:cytosine/uracil/thiamine/allantoin permease